MDSWSNHISLQCGCWTERPYDKYLSCGVKLVSHFFYLMPFLLEYFSSLYIFMCLCTY